MARKRFSDEDILGHNDGVGQFNQGGHNALHLFVWNF